MQADPQEAVARGPCFAERVADVAGDGLAHAVAVDRLVHNHIRHCAAFRHGCRIGGPPGRLEAAEPTWHGVQLTKLRLTEPGFRPCATKEGLLGLSLLR
ncbi:hypothetical protein GCM10022419_083480 [Nonomuraea rosea]|uniref:Uncharacterized protein n=1 Tax=Nonomuraea rosea TaxID=638574 RepID=A0ABP6YT31_9ACTN